MSMWRCALVPALGLSMLVTACGSAEPVYDASPADASAPDSICPIPELKSFIMTTFVLPSAEVGFDLDADGSIDNMTGNLPASARNAIAGGFQNIIDYGDGLFLLLVTGWDDPTSPNDPDVTVHITWSHDADQPWDPSDNFSGNEGFLLPASAFDLDCNLRNGTTEGQIVNGVLRARIDRWQMAFVNGSGTLVWENGWLECTLDSTLGSASCLVGATWPVCSMASSPLPGYGEGSVLDAFINDEALSSAVSVDSDMDGDGLEQIVGDGMAVLECVDGDGTEIRDRDCPCDGRIADGYTIVTQFDVVSAYVAGLII